MCFSSLLVVGIPCQIHHGKPRRDEGPAPVSGRWKHLTHVCLAFLGPFRADDGGSAPDLQSPRMEREWRSSTHPTAGLLPKHCRTVTAECSMLLYSRLKLSGSLEARLESRAALDSQWEGVPSEQAFSFSLPMQELFYRRRQPTPLESSAPSAMPKWPYDEEKAGIDTLNHCTVPSVVR
jgi:hypothetical protein